MGLHYNTKREMMMDAHKLVKQLIKLADRNLASFDFDNYEALVEHLTDALKEVGVVELNEETEELEVVKSDPKLSEVIELWEALCRSYD